MTAAPRSRATLQALAFTWLGLLVGFAVGVEWFRLRGDAPRPSGGIALVGAGATLPYPLYRQWFAEYGRASGVQWFAEYGRASGVQINYFSVGSGEGIRLLLEGSADFGAADRPLTPEERARASCGAVEVPTVLGAVAIAYRLPGLEAPLRLDAETLADIFLGRMTRWDDAPIQALNPGVPLPAIPIRPVQRARVTGTSAVFSRFLAASRRWRAAQAAGGTAGGVEARVEGNEGVTAAVSATEGAIGAVELTYAAQARLPVAAIRNADGEFVLPSAESVAAAAAVVTPETVDTLSGVVGAPGAGAYPVVALTRIVVDGALRDTTKAAHFLAFARWALREGAASATALGYAALPEAAAARELRYLSALTPGRCPALARP